MRDVWAFLVGDWHRSRVLGAALVGACMGCPALLIGASSAAFATDQVWTGAAMAMAVMILLMLAPVAPEIAEDVKASFRRSTHTGRDIIRTREQARRERGQLSVREQGGELSGVPQ
jgi:hypothetical protein